MGECLISRRGGESYKLPVLNASYPQDQTVMATSNGVATFSVVISEHGRPTEYAYQWYVNGEAVSGATGSNYTMSTTADNIGMRTVYCNVINKAGSVSSRVATLNVKNAIPTTYDYTGIAQLVEEDRYNWKLICTSSGNLTIRDDIAVDMFICGGGGAGASSYGENGNGGGGGGYIETPVNIPMSAGTYTVVVGAGGAGGRSDPGASGGASSISGVTNTTFNYVANGGTGGKGANDRSGGSGYGSGGYGGAYKGGGPSDGKDGLQAFGSETFYGGGGGGGGSDSHDYGGAGGKTGGGAGGRNRNKGVDAIANTGGGGGGAGGSQDGNSVDEPAGSGASGIVIIRNAR